LALGHHDRDKAKLAAEKLAVELRQVGPPKRVEAAKPVELTLSCLTTEYLREVTPGKAPQTQQHDRSSAAMFLRVFGDVPPAAISLRAWNDFIEARRAGAVRPGSLVIQGEKGRKVRDRVIAYDLKWLLAVLNWAASPASAGGKRLLPANPLEGYPVPSESSPRRPVLHAEQYAALVAAAEELPPLFRLALVLARETGHRIGAIRLLRWSDVDLTSRRVTWRAESDKIGYEHRTPLSAGAIAALDAAAAATVVAGGTATGDTWIFAGATGEPISRHMLNDWWQRAAIAAKLPKGERLGWHALRRQFATELKGTPIADLKALGGWKNEKTILECYQQPDEQTMRRALEQRQSLHAPDVR
jgi:integrase